MEQKLGGTMYLSLPTSPKTITVAEKITSITAGTSMGSAHHFLDWLFAVFEVFFRLRKTKWNPGFLGTSTCFGFTVNDSLEFCRQKLTPLKSVCFLTEVLIINVLFCSFGHLRIFSKNVSFTSQDFCRTWHTLFWQTQARLKLSFGYFWRKNCVFSKVVDMWHHYGS